MSTLEPAHAGQAAVWSAAGELVAALAATMRQLAEFLRGVTDEQYARKPGGALDSIGGHVRHSLDHIAALLAAVPGGALDYDRRARGTPVETDRRAGLAEARRLEHALAALAWNQLPAAQRLTLLAAADRPPVEVSTTPERELAFVLSHTIHHNALIVVIAGAVGASAPAGFGYAPSTLAHREAR